MSVSVKSTNCIRTNLNGTHPKILHNSPIDLCVVRLILLFFKYISTVNNYISSNFIVLLLCHAVMNGVTHDEC